MSRQENHGCYCLLILFGLICLGSGFGIFFSYTYKDMRWTNPYEISHAHYLESQVTTFRCCDQTNCDCTNSTIPEPWNQCSNYLNNLTVSLDCNNGYYVCETYCETCSREEEEDYDYDCYCGYDEDSVYTCQTCSGTDIKTVYFDCNCRPVRWVDYQHCQVECGNCTHIMTQLVYNVTIPNTQTISRDDHVCVEAWLFDHNTNLTQALWYERDRPTAIVWVEPHHEFNQTALGFAIFFFSGAVIFFVLTGICCYCDRKNGD